MNNLNSLDEILQFYGQKDSKHIYLDKTFNNAGIDYTNFIQLKFEDINKGNIKKLYTIDGWYILFYLMVNAYHAQYITTTIQIINKETKIRQEEIKKILEHLQGLSLIKIQENIFNIETVLHIAIGYNSNIINTITQTGFKAIPVEYLKTILPTISSKEWAILSVLFVKYSYFTVTEKKDEETGEIIYNYTVNHYAFPTQDQIGNSIGLNSKTIRIYTKKLNDNKYNILDIWKSKTNKSNLKNDNCRYSITLFERIEYIYYHIYCTDYSHKPKELELINKYGFDKIAKSEDQRILNIQDYIKYKYQTEMEEYKKCIDDNDADRYKKINKKLE